MINNSKNKGAREKITERLLFYGFSPHHYQLQPKQQSLGQEHRVDLFTPRKIQKKSKFEFILTCHNPAIAPAILGFVHGIVCAFKQGFPGIHSDLILRDTDADCDF
jgi:hypothetical protein